jgi:hypothetical protein
VGPFAIGGLPLFNRELLVILDETVRRIGKISAVVIFSWPGCTKRPGNS